MFFQYIIVFKKIFLDISGLFAEYSWNLSILRNWYAYGFFFAGMLDDEISLDFKDAVMMPFDRCLLILSWLYALKLNNSI